MRTFKNMYLTLAAFLFALILRNPVMAAGPDPVEVYTCQVFKQLNHRNIIMDF